jgi:hypothetical protein
VTVTENLTRCRLATIATLILVAILIGSSLTGCSDKPSPPEIGLDDVASFEIGVCRTRSIASVVDAYDHATPRSFNTETTPQPLATLHLRDGRVIQFQFSTMFPRDCVLTFVGHMAQADGTFYMLEAPGLLTAVCRLGGFDKALFERVQ